MSHTQTPIVLPTRVQYTELLMNLSFSMLNAMDEQIFFDLTLQTIGETLPVGRIFIFEHTDHIWHNTYEWTAPGISSQKESLQNISMEGMDKQHSMLHCILRGEIFNFADVGNIEDEITRIALQRQGIRSVLAVPLYYEGAVRGMLGFDICDQQVEWLTADISLIIAIGNVINSAKWHFQMRKVLQAKEQQLRDIVDAFPDPIYVADMESHRIVFANKSLTDVFGDVSIHDVPCHKVLQQLDEPCPFCTNASLQAEASSHTWQHHNSVLGRDFKIIDKCIPWEGTQRARLSIALDISDVLKSQREGMFSQETTTAKSTFVAHMSHEIRTPLNSIIGLNYLALKANTSPAVEEYLRKMHHSSTSLLGIINGILDFSKIESGKVVLESAPLSITKLVDSVHSMVEPDLHHKHLQWQVQVDPAIPPTVYGDSLRLSQILQNIVSNAVKFTEKGSITVNVGLEGAAEGCSLLQIQVRDTGIGMPRQVVEKLFSDFTLADSPTASHHGGMGLGLAIVKRLVEMMGGSVSVHSIEGKGTTFGLTIPFTVAEALDPAATDWVADEASYPQLEGLRVLLCEDNSITQVIVAEMLRQQGCSVDVADDGIEGVAMATFHKYDALLMDIQMPHMDGIEATQRIRENSALNTLPIIAMTANAMQGDYEKSLAAGMQDHVIKPIEPRQLYEALSRWCAPIRPDADI